MKKLNLKGAFVGAIFMLPVVAGFYLWGYRSHTPSKSDFTVASEQSQLDYVNKIRADHSVAPMTYDDGLNKTAQAKASDMSKRHYWDHTTPDGQPFYSLAESTRPGLQYYGENLGKCFTNNPELFKAYVASPEHLENIINPHYTLFGAATIWDDTTHCYINANEFGG